MVTVHKEKKPFECPVCGKIFAEKNTIKKHFTDIHQRRTNFAYCETCLRNFADETKLKRHTKSVHEEKKIQKCDENFSKNFKSKKHAKMVHKDKKVNRCSYCDLSVSSIVDLKKHIICS